MTETTMRDYDMIGYSVFKDSPRIITGIIIRDNRADIEMKVSVKEAQDLILTGKMDIPEPNNVS